MTRLRRGMTDTLDFLPIRLVLAGILLLVLGAAPLEKAPSTCKAAAGIAAGKMTPP